MFQAQNEHAEAPRLQKLAEEGLLNAQGELRSLTALCDDNTAPAPLSLRASAAPCGAGCRMHVTEEECAQSAADPALQGNCGLGEYFAAESSLDDCNGLVCGRWWEGVPRVCARSGAGWSRGCFTASRSAAHAAL